MEYKSGHMILIQTDNILIVSQMVLKKVQIIYHKMADLIFFFPPF